MVNDLINVQAVAEPTSDPIEMATSGESVTIATETPIPNNDTFESKTDSITSESETISNADTDTTKLSEPENSEMTGEDPDDFCDLFKIAKQLLNLLFFNLRV